MPAWYGSAKERILSNGLLPGVENLLNSGKAALRSEGFGYRLLQRVATT